MWNYDISIYDQSASREIWPYLISTAKFSWLVGGCNNGVLLDMYTNHFPWSITEFSTPIHFVNIFSWPVFQKDTKTQLI